MNGKGRKKKVIASVVIIGVLSIFLIVSAIGCGSCSCVISQPTDGSSGESLRPDSSEELTETDEGSASSDEETDDSTEEGTESIEPSESEDSSESETEVESESEDETDESSSERETTEGSNSSSSEPTTKPTQVSHSETPSVTPTVAPHTHNWKTEQVLVSAAWDEQVVTKAAWDEQILVKEAWDEGPLQDTIILQEDWDEEVWEVHDLCNFTGCTFDYTAYMREHNCTSSEAHRAHTETPENLALPPEQQHGGWHRENVLVNVIHHKKGDTMLSSPYYKHHDAEYQTIHHPAEYTTVHHDAVYKTVRKCSVCGVEQ